MCRPGAHVGTAVVLAEHQTAFTAAHIRRADILSNLYSHLAGRPRSTMLQRILTPWRLRVYPTAALAGVTVGFIVFIATSDGLRTLRGGRIGGDFPAFYAAGQFLHAGTPKLIYSQEALREAERPLLPGVQDGWLTFA